MKMSVSKFVYFLEKDMLMKFNNMPETPLEQKESIDMLRLLENGFKVQMVPVLVVYPNQLTQLKILKL